MSTLRATTLQDAAGSNSVTMATVAAGVAKAWVNFNGTGTVALRAAFNVASLTDNGTGDYTVNFNTAMPDTNFAGLVTASMNTSSFTGEYDSYIRTSSTFRIRTTNSAGTLLDKEFVSVAIFR